jgi:hypothetical protein
MLSASFQRSSINAKEENSTKLSGRPLVSDSGHQGGQCSTQCEGVCSGWCEEFCEIDCDDRYPQDGNQKLM